MTGNKSSRGSDHPFTALVFIWIWGAAAAAVMSLYEAQRAIQESIWMQMYYIMRRMHFCSRSKSSGLSTKKRSYSAKKKEKEIIIIFFKFLSKSRHATGTFMKSSLLINHFLRYKHFVSFEAADQAYWTSRPFWTLLIIFSLSDWLIYSMIIMATIIRYLCDIIS